MPADAGSPAPSRSTPARGVGKQRGGATSSDVDADYGRALKRVAVAPPRTRRGAGSAGSVGSDGSVANLTAAAGASGGAAATVAPQVHGATGCVASALPSAAPSGVMHSLSASSKNDHAALRMLSQLVSAVSAAPPQLTSTRSSYSHTVVTSTPVACVMCPS